MRLMPSTFSQAPKSSTAPAGQFRRFGAPQSTLTGCLTTTLLPPLPLSLPRGCPLRCLAEEGLDSMRPLTRLELESGKQLEEVAVVTLKVEVVGVGVEVEVEVGIHVRLRARKWHLQHLGPTRTLLPSMLLRLLHRPSSLMMLRLSTFMRRQTRTNSPLRKG